MRKLSTLLLAMVTCAGTMLASDTSVDGIWYNFDDEHLTAEVTYRGANSSSYSNEYSGEVVIPSSVTYNAQTYTVTSIGDYAFYECSGLTSVTIGNSVTSIGEWAFGWCSGLTSVTIPNSITSIGRGAFDGCTGLTSVTIPNSVTSIGDWAFQGCSGLTSLSVEAGNTVYDSRNNCNAIIKTSTNTLISGCQNTTIPNTITSIGWWALSGCRSLTSVTIPNSVTSIGSSAFFSCSSLTSVTIPNSVTSIGEGAFELCTGLTSLSVEAGNTVYDSRNNCNAIIETSTNTLIFGCQNTTIPNSVTSIGDEAFYYCSNLTSVTIPNSVKSIGDWAFYGCSSLTSVTIPNSVKSIGSYAFGYCSGLTSVTIPNSVTSIGEDAFYDCTGLTSVTIGNSVTSIGSSAFYSCSGLISITNYATTPQSINSNVFDNVNKSACTLYVPETSVSLYQSTDVWRDFENVLPIPPSVIASGECGAEGDNLTWELLDNGTLTITGTGAMADWGTDTDVPWYDYKSDIVSLTIGNNVTSIGDNAFYQCSNLISVTIGNSVTSIGDLAFAWCDVLTAIEIPNTVANIGGYAFSCCSSMVAITVAEDNTNYSSEYGVLFNKEKTILLQFPGGKAGAYTMPNSVVSIGDQAFVLCNALSSINIADDHPNYSSLDGVLFNKDKTTLVQYPGGRHGAFIIPNGVEHIGNYAFTYCSFLTFITIPNSVTSIGNLAFYRCDNLRAITCNAISPPSCGVAVFYIDKSLCKLYVPAESADLYMTSLFEWRDFQIGGAAMTAKADPDDASAYYTTFYHGSQKYKLPVGMEAYTATINGDVLVLTKVAEGGDVIPAGTAFILKSNAANLTMDATDETPVSVGENILQGVDAATSAPANCYVLSGKSSDNSVQGIGFYRFSGTLGAHKAYLVLAPKAGAPRRLRFSFNETNTTTSVEQVPSNQVPCTKVIENGQLYIIYNGEKYNVQGSRVQ